MPAIRRLFVEKLPEFAVEARALHRDLREQLGLAFLEGVRLAVRYDVQGLSDADLEAARWKVFAEPPVDRVHDEELPLGRLETALAVEYLPGQYDQRADSAAQCLQLLTHGARPRVACARVYVFRGALAPADLDRIRGYLVNPVDSRVASAAKPATLEPVLPTPPDVAVLEGFTQAGPDRLGDLHAAMGLAMTPADLAFTQAHFRDQERRDPTETELRLLDTYWSDHCRHTTFLTRITDVAVAEGPYAGPIARAYRDYRALRAELFADPDQRPECLMDVALLPARALRQAGRLDDQEVTSEINACSVMVDIDNTAAPGGREPWLLMFKNETHNHPTEIEPFGGAATCLGGAIRDPLSGRAYVYQSMRVTGSGDPRLPLDQTLPGKLPQRKITREAAHGFASYGNQIGLCTGQVVEYYDPGYQAKRMEIGAVVGAVPRAQVRREEPVPGDVIVLVGGRTGRDGIGGATGSSKAHTEASIETCGAEVQKGDPPMERKLQRLFRDPRFCRLVKKCNDFGAGGVSVAIGELAPGITVDLDVVPRKYEGLDGTELAIAESQERMAVVVGRDDAAELVRLAGLENLEATLVAEVTAEPRLRMTWRGRTIADLDRAFLDSNGAAQFARVEIPAPATADPFRAPALAPGALADRWLAALQDLNACSQRGLAEKFDCTIGAATVLAPFGGRLRRTPAEAMVAKFPVQGGATRSASAMSHGFLPALSRWSPFHGAVWAHVQAAARLAAVGGDHRKLRFTLQEYFGKPLADPCRWGQPFAALLGALHAEMALGTPAIGGKDSMSGTFNDLDVPPTLVAFAVGVVRADQVASPELKGPGHPVLLVDLPRTHEALPDWPEVDRILAQVGRLVREGWVLSARTVGLDGIAPALSVMAFGNGVGLDLAAREPGDWFAPRPGAFLLELATEPGSELGGLAWTRLGTTTDTGAIRLPGLDLPLDRALAAWEAPLEPVFPTRLAEAAGPATALAPFAPVPAGPRRAPAVKAARPRVVLSVFPGTNCEYDTAQVFERAGAETKTVVFRNLDPQAVEASLEALAAAIGRSQILVIPGGFSAGDEPEGSGKFIAAAYRNPRVADAVRDLLGRRDGLALGICNGFQALIKLGLVPYGEIRDLAPDSPTLTFNSLRYASRFAWTRVVSNASPWLARVEPGAVHTVAIAHGEGRIVGPEAALAGLLARGQVATQYVDAAGQPTLDLEYNPNGSALAIESLTSPDGRVLGKMAHPERFTAHVWRNVPGDKDQGIFQAGVDYFR